MKDLRCMMGIHEWTQWRRPTVKRESDRALMTPNEIMSQSRRCRRCPKTQSRPFPSSRKQPPGPQ